MPEIPLKHVVSCSSEDRNNPADNLLKAEGTHKWRTAGPGEKHATVVLQFEKACQITSVDIGNEGSAFVEVLVGKSTASDADYQVLLVSSSFMSPGDSRNGNNRNSVRMFGLDKLSKTVATEKWDRVKIVCTQPFNKSTAYGLSFIKFHTGSDSAKPAQKEGVKKLGAFFVKKDEDEEEIKVGALFANKGKTTLTPPPPALTGAAAVRAASRLAEEARASPSPSSSGLSSSSHPSTSRAGKDGNNASANSKASAAASAIPSPKKHALSDDDKTDEEEEEEKAPPPKVSLKRQSSSLSSVTSSRSSEAPPPLKKTKTEPPKPSLAKEFRRLMEGVTFSLSGFQNPYRGELREKALEMGATYKPDWGKGCTHLICAFTNTPKYNQVKGRGRIVGKQWINDCYKQKKLLPWRKYRLGDAESPDDSSGDDEEEERMSIGKKATPKRTPSASASKGQTSATPKQSKTKAQTESDEDDRYKGDTDSADDTDEEIRRATSRAKPQKETPSKRPETATTPKVQAEFKVKPSVKATTKPDPDLDLFADSTDEDEPAKNSVVAMDTNDDGDDDDGADSGLPDLPDFFAEKHFFLYGSFDSAEKRLLTRYIAAYDGVLEDYMTGRVKFVLTNTAWDDNFEEALKENPGLIFIKPQWIHRCHQNSKLMAYQPYIVVP